MGKQTKLIIILLLVLLTFGFITKSTFSDKKNQIKIQWVEHLKGDFDFSTKWSYPEGIYRNAYGQLSCDGFCPEETESMIDSDGKINADSLIRFYQLVDTSHQFHSILCEAWCYEWAGTDFITVKRTTEDKIVCATQTNAGTHCSLVLEISHGNCTPSIALMSITSTGKTIYDCKGGFMIQCRLVKATS